MKIPRQFVPTTQITRAQFIFVMSFSKFIRFSWTFSMHFEFLEKLFIRPICYVTTFLLDYIIILRIEEKTPLLPFHIPLYQPEKIILQPISNSILDEFTKSFITNQIYDEQNWRSGVFRIGSFERKWRRKESKIPEKEKYLYK